MVASRNMWEEGSAPGLPPYSPGRSCMAVAWPRHSRWENFFIGELGASAVLTGLVFVGNSINLKKIMESPFTPKLGN